jgi:hypothetical protein
MDTSLPRKNSSFTHYGFDGGDAYDRRAEDRDVDDSVTPRSDVAGDYERSDRDDARVGRDVSDPATDDAMTLSEKQVRVGTELVERSVGAVQLTAPTSSRLSGRSERSSRTQR